MNRNALQSLIATGVFVGGGGLILALLQPKDSPEFVISLCSAGIGLALVGLGIAINRFLR